MRDRDPHVGEPAKQVEQFYESDEKPAWRVTAEYLRREQVLVNFSTHSVISDHARGLGGDDMGPSPGELLMAALSACTTVYVARAAHAKEMPVESIAVRAKFAPGFEPGDEPLPTIGFLERIDKQVEVSGDLTHEQLDELRYVAEHCAIGETLRRGVELHEDLVHVDAADADVCVIEADGTTSCCAPAT